MKKVVSLITTFAMVMTMFTGISPVEVMASSGLTGQIEHIEFGSYPQTEIVGDATQSGIYDRSWEMEGDYEIDADIYKALQEETGWEDDDKTVSGKRYHRIKKSDATSVSENTNRYNWSDDNTYHYFRYDPITWRILETKEGEAFLIADICLDVQKFNEEQIDVTWETCSLRTWLNGNFLNNAFSDEERNAILEKTVKSEDSAGNDTIDKVFILSKTELSSYEFTKQSKSSTYAKAMGAFASRYSNSMITCKWWLRSPASCYNNKAAYVAVGGNTMDGDYVDSGEMAIRPAIYLNLNSDEYKTVYVEESVDASDISYEKSASYDGTEKKPEVKIYGLKNGVDYTVEYSNNINPGTGEIKVTGIGNWSGTVTKEFDINIAGIKETGELTRNVSQKLIEFGSYPQTEIVGEDSQSGVKGKSWEIEGDYEVDAGLYETLQEKTGWKNNDKTVSGKKYRRVKSSDAVFVHGSTLKTHYYDWSDDESYHYFRYDPIKWRVLNTDGEYALLLADICLDCQKYNVSEEDVTWETCSLRTWLNKTFFDRAFTEDEKDAVEKNDTKDKAFLLLQSEISGADGVKYGFMSKINADDKARQSKSSTYAKAMGLSSCTSTNNLGTAYWWLQTMYREDEAVLVIDHGSIQDTGRKVTSDFGIRPSIYLDLNFSDLYKEAGSTEAFEQNIDEFTIDSDIYLLKDGKVTPQVSITGLTEGKDYEVSYSDNDKPGTAKVTVTGKGEWSGSISRNFAIVESIDLSTVGFYISGDDVVYRGVPCCPEIEAGNRIYGKTYRIESLVKDKDYTVSYEDNNGIGTGKFTVTAVKGSGYTGSRTVTFKIQEGDLAEKYISLSSSEYTYTGSEIRPDVEIKGLNEGVDYTVSYSDNVNAGTGTITATGKGYFKGTCTRTFKITQADIADKKIKCQEAIVYTGKTLKPSVTVSGLKSSTDFTTVTSSKYCGKATVTIKGKGNYTGTVTKSIKILPAKAKITKVSAGQKSITVTVKSQKASKISGYQISYKEAGGKTKTVTTTSTTKKIKGLKKGKKYTVKVRAYKTIDGKKVYGAYSASKTAKAK